jgi:hypothetical protein
MIRQQILNLGRRDFHLQTFKRMISIKNKDPGPEGPALIHPGEVILVSTFASSVQVSGVGCQQPISTRCLGVAHEMDFLPPVFVLSCNPISVHDSLFTDT